MKQYPFYKIYVAEENNQILGTFSLLVCDNLGHGGVKFALVDNVVVVPAHQGSGIGKAMMLRAMELAREKGSYKLMLSSNKGRVRAHEFYKHLGFEPHGTSFMTGLL